MLNIIKFIGCSCGMVLLLLTTISQASNGELQLRNFTPSVKTVNISLQGAKSVMPHLNKINDLISDVLQSSKLHVMRVPTTEDPKVSMVIPTVENLDIHISMPTPDEINSQSYLFNLSTKLADQATKTQSFVYFPNNSDALYQSLQQYFAKLLNLEISLKNNKLNSGTDADLNDSESDVTQVSDAQTVKIHDAVPHSVISDVLNTKRAIALPVDNLEPIHETENTADLNNSVNDVNQFSDTETTKIYDVTRSSDLADKKQTVTLPVDNLEPIQQQEITQQVVEKKRFEPQQTISPQQEIELRNLTPAVKSVEIRLRGSIREQKVLDDIHAMISEILRTSRLSVIQVPVVEDAITTPAIKLYEHLEIIIQAFSPEQAGQPYIIQLSFQEKDKAQKNVQQQTFEYVDSNAKRFYEQLRAYMSEHINLSPRYQTTQ